MGTLIAGHIWVLRLASALGFLAASAGAYRRFRRSTALPLPDRLVFSLVPLLAVTAACIFILRVLGAPIYLHDWNARRLVTSFALRAGYRLFYAAGQGPAITGLNGPLQPIAFLPATVASHPLSAIMLGSLLAGLYFLLPVILISRSGRSAALAYPNAFWLTWFLIGQAYVSVVEASFRIHADAPGLCLSALAVICLTGDRVTTRRIAAALLCAVAAALTKVTFAPVVPAVLALAWRRRGGKGLALAVSLTACVVLLVAAALLLWYPKEVWIFQFWTSNISHASASGTGPAGLQQKVVDGAANLFRIAIAFPILSVIAGASLLSPTSWMGRSHEMRPGFPFYLCGFFLSGTAAMALAKYGAEANTVAPVVYFFLLGTLCEIFSGGKRESLFRLPLRDRWLPATLVVAALLVGAKILYSLYWPLTYLQNNHDEIAFDASRHMPGVIYFPEYPLSSLLAEGRLYHSGVYVLEIADAARVNYLSPERLRAFLPERLRYVAFDHPQFKRLVDTIDPAARRAELAALPGWQIYQVSDPTRR